MNSQTHPMFSGNWRLLYLTESTKKLKFCFVLYFSSGIGFSKQIKQTKKNKKTPTSSRVPNEMLCVSNSVFSCRLFHILTWASSVSK